MSPNCIEVERIADVEALAPDHPSRRHLEECPRCRSLWLSYQTFMAIEPVGGARPDAARLALAEFIRRRMAGTLPAQRPTRFTLRSLWAAPWRPIPLAAAAMIVVVAAVVLFRGGGRDEAPVLRGDSGVTAALTLNDPTRLADGSIQFSWSAAAEADAYEVRVYGPDLAELARRPATGTSLVVEAGFLPAGELTWRVVALHDGDVIETSAPASVTLP